MLGRSEGAWGAWPFDADLLGPRPTTRARGPLNLRCFWGGGGGGTPEHPQPWSVRSVSHDLDLRGGTAPRRSRRQRSSDCVLAPLHARMFGFRLQTPVGLELLSRPPIDLAEANCRKHELVFERKRDPCPFDRGFVFSARDAGLRYEFRWPRWDVPDRVHEVRRANDDGQVSAARA